MNNSLPNPRWPNLLDPTTTTGTIRSTPDDFQVEEIPAYLPSGQGEHLFLQIEKRGLTTQEVIAALAHQLGIPDGEIGSAGLKDKHAVTRQWLSLPRRAEKRLCDFSLPGLTILQQSAHGNKLKTGHLKGNRFRIRIREIPIEQQPAVLARLEILRRRGVPNYFGPQRFGRDNEAEGLRLLIGQGRRHPPRTLRLLLSSVQSALFNDLLALRLSEGRFERVWEGDVLSKADSGGLFVCSQPELDQPRLDAFEVHLTGPLFGPRMKQPSGLPAEWEAQILKAHQLGVEAFERFARLTQGGRRPLRIPLAQAEARTSEDAIELSFDLPSGSYATVVLAELVQTQESTHKTPPTQGVQTS